MAANKQKSPGNDIAVCNGVYTLLAWHLSYNYKLVITLLGDKPNNELLTGIYRFFLQMTKFTYRTVYFLGKELITVLLSHTGLIASAIIFLWITSRIKHCYLRVFNFRGNTLRLIRVQVWTPQTTDPLRLSICLPACLSIYLHNVCVFTGVRKKCQ